VKKAYPITPIEPLLKPLPLSSPICKNVGITAFYENMGILTKRE
jgi:hypothetical protein